jgi:hypothetical protein
MVPSFCCCPLFHLNTRRNAPSHGAVGSGLDDGIHIPGIEAGIGVGGRERTQQEFDRLLSNAGFRLVCTNRTVMSICVLEAELA